MSADLNRTDRTASNVYRKKPTIDTRQCRGSPRIAAGSSMTAPRANHSAAHGLSETCFTAQIDKVYLKYHPDTWSESYGIPSLVLTSHRRRTTRTVRVPSTAEGIVKNSSTTFNYSMSTVRVLHTYKYDAYEYKISRFGRAETY